MSSQALAGSLLQYKTPNWEPLRGLISLDLCDWFMWMHSIRLEDGREVHAYKHQATRRYFHIALDGATYEYRCSASDRYVPISRADAISEAFSDWELLWPQPEDVDGTRASLEAAIACASAGKPVPDTVPSRRR